MNSCRDEPWGLTAPQLEISYKSISNGGALSDLRPSLQKDENGDE